MKRDDGGDLLDQETRMPTRLTLHKAKREKREEQKDARGVGNGALIMLPFSLGMTLMGAGALMANLSEFVIAAILIGCGGVCISVAVTCVVIENVFTGRK